jgi:glycerol-3-phosphate dehydrogenase
VWQSWRLRAAGLYPDAQTDDARLCIAILSGVANAGALVLNRAELVRLEPGPVAVVHDGISGTSVELSARAVVNATGPWVDEVRRIEDRSAGTSVTLSKGADVVLERRGECAHPRRHPAAADDARADWARL